MKLKVYMYLVCIGLSFLINCTRRAVWTCCIIAPIKNRHGVLFCTSQITDVGNNVL